MAYWKVTRLPLLDWDNPIPPVYPYSIGYPGATSLFPNVAISMSGRSGTAVSVGYDGIGYVQTYRIPTRYMLYDFGSGFLPTNIVPLYTVGPMSFGVNLSMSAVFKPFPYDFGEFFLVVNPGYIINTDLGCEILKIPYSSYTSVMSNDAFFPPEPIQVPTGFGSGSKVVVSHQYSDSGDFSSLVDVSDRIIHTLTSGLFGTLGISAVDEDLNVLNVLQFSVGPDEVNSVRGFFYCPEDERYYVSISMGTYTLHCRISSSGALQTMVNNSFIYLGSFNGMYFVNTVGGLYRAVPNGTPVMDFLESIPDDGDLPIDDFGPRKNVTERVMQVYSTDFKARKYEAPYGWNIGMIRKF